MTGLPLDGADLAGLEFLDGMATPLWLARSNGETIWLNRSARTLLALPATAAAATIRMEPTAQAQRAFAAAAAGHRTESRLILHRSGPRDGGPVVEVEAWLSPAPCGGALVLVEAPADSGARQEVMRLTEQMVALSYAYPDIRFELGRDGTILDFAAANPADLNVPAGRFLNRRIQDVLPEAAAAPIASALERLDAERTVTGVDFTLPAPPGAPGGEKFFETRLVALMDGERALCSIRNVTERVHAAREARRAHDLLVDAIECMTEGFVLYDAQDRLVLCNSKYRELFSTATDLVTPGTSFESVLREGARRGLYSMPAHELDDWVARRVVQHRTAGPPLEVQLRTGRWLRIEEWRTHEGGTVGIRADITNMKEREAELRAARDEAEQANRRKSDYVHHLSHELRTPLTAVMGFAQIIRDELMGPRSPRYLDYAQQIAAAGVYMLDLINNLLDLAKIEAGRMDLNEEACNLALLVDLTFGMMQPRAEEAAVALVMEIDDDLPAVLGDASLIRQMLTNLIGNAIKFARRSASPPGGRVLVRAERREDGAIRLSVADDGIGMSPEQIPRALDAFGQVHGRAVASQQGSGLGLPLTRALIALHGGDLRIESELGVGTTVALTFPASRVGVAADCETW